MQSGLKVGDVIVKANGRPITSREDLMAAILTLQVGDQIEMEILREGNRIFRINYTLLEWVQNQQVMRRSGP